MLISRNLPEQPVHLKWVPHLLLISVYQRSLAVSNFLFGCLQPCAVNGYLFVSWQKAVTSRGAAQRKCALRRHLPLICLSWNGVASTILLDESEARRVAALYSLTKTGVVGLLLRAKNEAKISSPVGRIQFHA